MKLIGIWYGLLAALLAGEAFVNAATNDGPLIPRLTSAPYVSFGEYPGRYFAFWVVAAAIVTPIVCLLAVAMDSFMEASA